MWLERGRGGGGGGIQTCLKCNIQHVLGQKTGSYYSDKDVNKPYYSNVKMRFHSLKNPFLLNNSCYV